MTESCVLHWAGLLASSGGTWSCCPLTVELSCVSHLSVAQHQDKGWLAAGLITEGTKTEMFLLSPQSSLKTTLPKERREDPILSCELDCSGSLVCLATQNKLYLLSAITGDILLSREVSQLAGVHWSCHGNILIISASDGTLTFTSRTLGKFTQK